MAAGTPMAGEVYFNVITNAEVLKSIADGTKAAMANSGMEMLVKLSSNPSYNPLYSAPVAVIISTTKTDVPNTAAMARANAACAGEKCSLPPRNWDSAPAILSPRYLHSTFPKWLRLPGSLRTPSPRP